MTDWTLLLNQLPLLLVCIPICGCVTVVLVNLLGREHVLRTFQLNSGLTFGCALLILWQFQSGPERTGLPLSESFQSVIVLQQSEFSTGLRFGVDGCSLPLIMLVSVFPLLASWPRTSTGTKLSEVAKTDAPELTCGRAALMLLLQALLLIFLLALDRRVQLVMLLLSTFVLSVELATSLPSGRRTLLTRWQRQTVLSDFLIAGGVLATLAPLAHQAGLGTDPGSLFDLVRVLAATELLQDDDLPQYVRLMWSMIPSLFLVLIGCSFRFGMLPTAGATRTMWEQIPLRQKLLIWAQGPLLGTAFLLRELQLFPLAAYQVISYLKYLWLLGLFLAAVYVRLSSGNRRESGWLVYDSCLLLLALSGPNPISLAGAFLLLVAMGFRLLVQSDGQTAGLAMRILRFATAFLFTAGAVCVLIGHWQGLGPESRHLGFAFSIGVTLLLAGGSGWNATIRERQPVSPLLPQMPYRPEPASGELPIWDVSDSPVIGGSETAWQTSLRTAGMILAVCLLLLFPNFLWQRIRWDVRRIVFPEIELSLSEREGQP